MVGVKLLWKSLSPHPQEVPKAKAPRSVRLPERLSKVFSEPQVVQQPYFAKVSWHSKMGVVTSGISEHLPAGDSATISPRDQVTSLIRTN